MVQPLSKSQAWFSIIQTTLSSQHPFQKLCRWRQGLSGVLDREAASPSCPQEGLRTRGHWGKLRKGTPPPGWRLAGSCLVYHCACPQ